MFSWSYTPISIRLISKDTPHALSGIHLVLHDESHAVLSQLFLTISHLPVSALNLHEIYISHGGLVQEPDIFWYGAQYEFHSQLLDSDAVFFFKHLLENGFRLLPNENNCSNVLSSICILGLRLKQPTSLFAKSKGCYKNVTFAHPSANDRILIHSFPFTFSSPLLFSDYTVNGHVTYCRLLVCLTDVKYLDNMAGGVVNSGPCRSVGLVLGSLRKLNGDGDLLAFVPWSRIWQVVTEKLNIKALVANVRVNKLVQPASQDAMSRSWENTRPQTGHKKASNGSPLAGRKALFSATVFPVVVSQSSSLFWGSCVYLNESTLVTNHHVISPYSLDSVTFACSVYLLEKTVLTLTLEDVVSTPFPTLDVAFITLSHQNRARLKELRFHPVTYSFNYSIGDEVMAVGYGLFFNKLHVSPLSSKGHISAKIERPFFEGSKRAPCMIVTSSSCWNGSSGGGLFDQNGSMVGMICSNAQVKLSHRGQNGEKTEKIPSLSFCIPIELILAAYRNNHGGLKTDLNRNIECLWALGSEHRDVIVGENLPKL